MSKFYIMIIEESIKTFSLIGCGNDFKFSFAVKGQTSPLTELNQGDKIVGYVSNDKKVFSYLFEAHGDARGNECVITKAFETANGPVLNSMDNDIENTISSFEQDSSLITINEEQYNRIVSAMLSKSEEEYVQDLITNDLPERSPRSFTGYPLNMILYGAPGTGKTYATTEYAMAIINKKVTKLTPEERKALVPEYKEKIKSGQIVFTTFHQSYGYEDFIQGLRPILKSDIMKFKNSDGVFKKIADKAMRDNENNYVIIIDEINRANISKVFGELITLIETDKRWGEVNEMNVMLPSGDVFAIPNNLYIIGTMNSADKSISLIDTALRRRFEFIEIKPEPELIKDDILKKALENLNGQLLKELKSTDLLIGHAYFINKSEHDFIDIMNRSLIPLLYEYFYDNSEKVKSIVINVINDNYKVKGEGMGRIQIVAKKE